MIDCLLTCLLAYLLTATATATATAVMSHNVMKWNIIIIITTTTTTETKDTRALARSLAQLPIIQYNARQGNAMPINPIQSNPIHYPAPGPNRSLRYAMQTSILTRINQPDS